MRIADIGLRAAIEKLLPHCVIGGRFACRVQDDIIAHGAHNSDHKSGDRFTEVVTDADIAIESYFGVVMNSLFEDVTFYGEEHERDRVSEYFPKDRPYLMTLDPVDGTRYFADGLPIFSTIITICVDLEIRASIIYVPRDEKFFYAVKDEGAWTTTAAEVAAGAAPTPYTIPAMGNLVLLDPKLSTYKERLVAAGFDVCLNTIEYAAQPDWKKTNLRMFYGDVVGRILESAQLIDACAEAFIVAEAGGANNGPIADAATLRSGLLVSATHMKAFDALMVIVSAKR